MNFNHLGFIFSIFFSFSAIGFDNDFKPVNGKTPLEFNLMFDSMKSESKKASQQLLLIAFSKDLNENLMPLEADHIFLLLKTEVTKGVLEFDLIQPPKFDINEAFITKVEKSILAKKDKYSRFSQWIAQSILAELKFRKESGIITDKSFNPNSFSGEKKLEAERFNRYLKYLAPWMHHISYDSAEDFNALTMSVSQNIFTNIVSRSKLIKLMAPSSTSNSSASIINIPQKLLNLKPEQIKSMAHNEPGAALTLSEQSQQEKVEAAKEIEAVTPLDMSTLSEDVAKELDKKEQKSPQDTP